MSRACVPACQPGLIRGVRRVRRLVSIRSIRPESGATGEEKNGMAGGPRMKCQVWHGVRFAAGRAYKGLDGSEKQAVGAKMLVKIK